jgi:hypothetical protein
MPVVDTSNQECIGYLSDVSSQGFKLESPKPISPDVIYSLRLDLTSAISSRSYIILQAKSVWSHGDPILPNEYVHGFQILSIAPDDQVIFQRIIENYCE